MAMALATAASADTLKVVQISGVALRRPTPDADWRPLSKDDIIKQGEEVRALEKGQLVVSMGSRSEWVLQGSTTIFAGGLSDSKNSAQTVWMSLVSGHVAVMFDKADASRDFHVKTPYGIVKVEPGIVSIISDSKSLTIANGRGKTCLEREKKEKACVDPLNTLHLDSKSSPAQINGDIPDGVRNLWAARKWQTGMAGKPELKVISPVEGRVFGSPNIFVTGYTSKGITLLVNKSEVNVAKDGGFSAPVSLFEGENKIVVEARSATGEVTRVTRNVKLDSIAPILSVTQPTDNFDMSLYGNCSGNFCSIQIFGLTEPGVALTVNGQDQSRHVEDDGSFYIPDFRIRQSERSITIQVEDSLGQRSVEVLYILKSSDADGDGIPDAVDQCMLDPSC